MPKYLRHKTSLLKEIMPKGSQNPLNRTKRSVLQSVCFPSWSPFPFSVSVFNYCMIQDRRVAYQLGLFSFCGWIRSFLNPKGRSQCYQGSEDTYNTGTELWDIWCKSLYHRLSVSMTFYPEQPYLFFMHMLPATWHVQATSDNVL